MLNDLDMVVLTQNLAEHGLQQGDVGTIVHRYERGDAFEVEFVTAEGATVAVLTLGKAAIRPVGGQEILHVRPLVATPA